MTPSGERHLLRRLEELERENRPFCPEGVSRASPTSTPCDPLLRGWPYRIDGYCSATTRRVRAPEPWGSRRSRRVCETHGQKGQPAENRDPEAQLRAA